MIIKYCAPMIMGTKAMCQCVRILYGMCCNHSNIKHFPSWNMRFASILHWIINFHINIISQIIQGCPISMSTMSRSSSTLLELFQCYPAISIQNKMIFISFPLKSMACDLTNKNTKMIGHDQRHNYWSNEAFLASFSFSLNKISFFFFTVRWIWR